MVGVVPNAAYRHFPDRDALLGRHFFNAESVSYRGDGHVVVRIAPSNSEDAAALQLLRPDRFRRRDEIGFAYQDDGGNMRVETIESESLQGRTTFTVELSRAESNRGTYIHEMAVNNYTPDEVAEVRAHLLLLGKLPSDVPRRDLDFLRTFLGIDLAVDNGALLPRLVRELKLPPSELLPRARLVAVHTLKNTRTVEHVLDSHSGLWVRSPSASSSFSTPGAPHERH